MGRVDTNCLIKTKHSSALLFTLFYCEVHLACIWPWRLTFLEHLDNILKAFQFNECTAML